MAEIACVDDQLDAAVLRAQRGDAFDRGVCGLVVDGLYLALGLSAAATLGEVAETLPEWLLLAATVVLLLCTLPALVRWLGRLRPMAG